MAQDPLGHRLLESRLEQIPGEIAGMVVRGLPQLRPGTLASEEFVVTGTGSSEAHARYFAHLINLYTDRTATYLPLSTFLSPSRELVRGRTLVVFSQGVSPNAQLALRRHTEFAHTVLFTSTTPVFARQAGREDRADLISDIVEGGGDLVLFPIAEEYSTLIRFVGPMCGYLVSQQFVAQFADCSFKAPTAGALLPLFELPVPSQLQAAVTQTPELFQGGFNIVCTTPISDFAHNLAYKFMEGLFWNCPQMSDFLQFAHGSFQQSTAKPRPVLVLQGEESFEEDLVQRSLSMSKAVGLPHFLLKVNAPVLHSIFGFESVINKLVMQLMVRTGIDQINWPGKDRDDALYGFTSDSPGAR